MERQWQTGPPRAERSVARAARTHRSSRAPCRVGGLAVLAQHMAVGDQRRPLPPRQPGRPVHVRTGARTRPHEGVRDSDAHARHGRYSSEFEEAVTILPQQQSTGDLWSGRRPTGPAPRGTRHGARALVRPPHHGTMRRTPGRRERGRGRLGPEGGLRTGAEDGSGVKRIGLEWVGLGHRVLSPAS